MNSQVWAFVIILHSFLRIGMIIFCITRAKAMNRNILGWGIFALFIPLLAFIWIILINVNRQGRHFIERKEKHLDETESMIRDNFKIEEEKRLQLLRSIENQELELSSLKSHNLLTEDEIINKNQIITNKKEAILIDLEYLKLSQELERVKSVVIENVTPIMGLLKNTFESNLLTQQEFDQKKFQLYNEKFKSILNVPYCNSKFTFHIETINVDNLSHVMRKEIKDSFKNTKFGQVLLYRKGTSKVLRATFDEFADINKPELDSDYIYIDIPNFLTLIGYPCLQKRVENGVQIEISSLIDEPKVI